MYDIAIVGSGPAGSTLARLIGKKYKVLLIDKRHFTQEYSHKSYEKCCGGLLAPDAQKILAKLGLGIPKDVMVDPQIFVVRTIDLYNKIERFYQRFYFNLDREKFDKWLLSLVPSEVDIRNGCILKDFDKNDNYFNIKIYDSNTKKEYTEKAKILVGADGASSLVRKKAFRTDDISRYISVQEWFKVKEAMPYFSAIFDPTITDFYSWTIPKGEYMLVGSALNIDDNPISKFKLLKNKLDSYGYNLSKVTKKEGAFILRPYKTKNICTGNKDIALIGEAAGWISPSSAEGFSYAFHSAYILAESLKHGLDGFSTRYNKGCNNLKRNIILKNLKSPVMYNKILRKMAMSSGIQSVKLFDSNISDT
ncbi:FAD-binding protein [Clostridiisalibacter paucivorans]|uniref:FAD-binding protein n=1 Tax=Clostridiisalibacter paucivorans TaxID=408753 RepID=UPI000478DA0F|nr:FAD-binding protein [Clostridiisalibacter paucivorans]